MTTIANRAGVKQWGEGGGWRGQKQREQSSVPSFKSNKKSIDPDGDTSRTHQEAQNRPLQCLIKPKFRRFLVVAAILCCMHRLVNLHFSKTTPKDHRSNGSKIQSNLQGQGGSLLPLQNDRSIMYLHVGKTGGITLDRILRSNCEYYQNPFPRKKCFEQLQCPESVLSYLTKMTVHIRKTNVQRFAKDNATSFFFTVRNPINRAISSFDMDHPINIPTRNPYATHMRRIFYEKCFPTIKDLATVLENKYKYNRSKIVIHQDFHNRNTTVTIDCFGVGQMTLKGKGHILYNTHLSSNYKFYADLTTAQNPEKEVLIVRTESLWNDTTRLNLALAKSLKQHGAVFNATLLHHQEETGSMSSFKNISGFVYSHGQEGFTVRSGLSVEGKKTLCCELSEENQVFEYLVRKAANIGEDDKERYLDRLYSDCGITGSDREQFQLVSGERESESKYYHHGVLFYWEAWATAQGCN